MTGRTILRLLPPVLLVAGLVAGCSDDSAVADVTTTAPIVTDVDALDNRFEAPAITVQAGTTVRFVNAGRNDHNVLPDTGDAWGVQKDAFKPGDEYSYAFDTPGSYLYVCTIHGTVVKGKGVGMTGTIEVTAP